MTPRNDVATLRPEDISNAGLGGRNDAGHPAPEKHRVSSAALWFGLFGAPAAWSVQTLADYSTNAHACFPHLFPLGTPIIGAGRMWAVLAIVSILAIVVGALALVTSLHSYRATKGEAKGETHWLLDVGEGRTRFMALSGAMMAAVFLLASLVHGASLLLAAPCSY